MDTGLRQAKNRALPYTLESVSEGHSPLVVSVSDASLVGLRGGRRRIRVGQSHEAERSWGSKGGRECALGGNAQKEEEWRRSGEQWMNEDHDGLQILETVMRRWCAMRLIHCDSKRMQYT